MGWAETQGERRAFWRAFWSGLLEGVISFAGWGDENALLERRRGRRGHYRGDGAARDGQGAPGSPGALGGRGDSGCRALGTQKRDSEVYEVPGEGKLVVLGWWARRESLA